MKLSSVSVIVPVKNERHTIQDLVAGIEGQLSKMSNLSWYEIIFVDDGSTDGTVGVIEEICHRNPDIRAIVFRKNQGKSAALAAGFSEASGDICVTMDGDMQDEPSELPRLLEKLNQGYDLVSGWKRNRNDPLEKVIPSRVFNWVVSRATGVKLHDFNCGFKAYRSWCVKDLRVTGNLYRFLPVFVDQLGGRVAEVPVRHNPRRFGESKYGFMRYFHGFVDLFTVLLLTRFLIKPTYFFAMFALPFLFLGSALGIYLLGSHIYWLFSGLQDYQLINRPLLIIAVGFFGFGINIFLVGLLGEFMLSMSNQSRSVFLESSILKRVNRKKHEVL